MPVTVPAVDDCDGDPGWSLSFDPPEAPIGSDFCVNLEGPPGALSFFMVSPGEGPIDSADGTSCRDFPLDLRTLLPLDSNGQRTLCGKLPCNPDLIGLVLYAQHLTCGQNDRGLSHQVSLL